MSKSIHLTAKFCTLITIVIVYSMNSGWGIKTDFNFRPVSFYERTNFSRVCLELEKIDSGVVLTYGEISRLVPLNCLKPILIDTTQIDFVPYVPEIISYLSLVMDEIYGVPFNSRKDLEDLYLSDINPGFRTTPSGTIDSIYQKPLWPFRSEERWNFLGCKFKFQSIVTDSNLKLQIDSLIQVKDFNIYILNPNECGSGSPSKYIDTSSSTIIEFNENGEPFIWLNDIPTKINIKSLSKRHQFAEVKFNFSPNPCKKPRQIEVKYNNKSKVLSVGNVKSDLILNLVLKPKSTTDIKIFAYNLLEDCKVSKDSRNFLAKIDSIDFNYKLVN